MLLSEYQDEMKEIQDKYIQQLWVLYRKNLPKISTIDAMFLEHNHKLECYLNIVKRNNSNSTIEEKTIEETKDEPEVEEEEQEQEQEDEEFIDLRESALKVIEDIETKKIFDDIIIDFDSILVNVTPHEDTTKVNQMLVNYYEEIHDVLQNRLDECQDIIEEYMTYMIENKKKDLHMQMEKYAMGEDIDIDPNMISDNTKNDITSITEDHNSKLRLLREQYDEFLRSAESEFFNVLKMIKLDPKSKSKLSNEKFNLTKEFDEIYAEGELAKVARDFLEKQKESLKSNETRIKEDRPNLKMTTKFDKIDSKSQPKSGNIADVQSTRLQISTDKNFVKGQIKAVNQSKAVIGHQKSPVYEFKQTTENYENEDSSMFQEGSEYVDYNKEVLSKSKSNLDKILKEQSETSNYSYYSSDKKLNVDKAASKKENFNLFTPKEKMPFADRDFNSVGSAQKIMSEESFVWVKKGEHHNAAISKEGHVYTWGRGLFGQLGHGTDESYTIPKLVSSLVKIPIWQVSWGWQHTMALSNSKNSVFSWGYGKYGQLGHGDTKNYLMPKEIKALSNLGVNLIEWGHSHSGAISDGEIYMWGLNLDSRLFLDHWDNVLVPSLTLMSELKREDPDSFYAMKIALGNSHSAAITMSGEVFTSGSNADGQLGIHPGDISSNLNSDENEEALYSPLNQVLPYGDDNNPKAKEVICGDSFTLILDDSNQMQIYGKWSEEQIKESNKKMNQII